MTIVSSRKIPYGNPYVLEVSSRSTRNSFKTVSPISTIVFFCHQVLSPSPNPSNRPLYPTDSLLFSHYDDAHLYRGQRLPSSFSFRSNTRLITARSLRPNCTFQPLYCSAFCESVDLIRRLNLHFP